MPYVHRDALGRIDSLHRGPSAEAREFLADAHPEVQSFIGRPRQTGGNEGFSQLDAGFVRVLEDLIDVLIARNVINITDLPQGAQGKLFARKSFRESAQRHSLRLFGDVSQPDVVDDTDFTELR